LNGIDAKRIHGGRIQQSNIQRLEIPDMFQGSFRTVLTKLGRLIAEQKAGKK